jgi:hypothetical protein
LPDGLESRVECTPNAATLVDLYDRIRLLEERLAAVESDTDR